MRQLVRGLLLILALISFKASEAQLYLTAPSGATISNVRYVPSGRWDVLNHNDSEIEVKGTPYFHETYLRGEIYLDGEKFSNIAMRYNIFDDRFEFKEKDSVLAIGPDPIIKKISIGAQTFIIDTLKVKDKRFPSYFQRLDSGRVTLMAKSFVIFKEMERAKAIQGDVPPRYERMPDVYYIKIGKGPLAKIGSIKKLIEILPDHASEMEIYSQREKIRTNNEDLTKFIHYYNTL